MSDWTAVIAEVDLPEGKSTRVATDLGDLLVHRSGEKLFAIAVRCTHQGAPLDRGPVRIQTSMQTVTCPAHGSVFDLETGRVMRGPATTPVAAYETRINDGAIEVRVRSEDA